MEGKWRERQKRHKEEEEGETVEHSLNQEPAVKPGALLCPKWSDTRDILTAGHVNCSKSLLISPWKLLVRLFVH